jgi:hypothetical protein
MAMRHASTYERKMNIMIMKGNEASPQSDPMPSRSVEGSRNG